MSRSSTRLSTIGIAYVTVLTFVLGGAIVRDINLMLIVAGVMMGPLVLSWRIAARMLRRVSLTREYPDGMTAGETINVQLTLTNPDRRQGIWGVTVEERIERVRPEPSEEGARVEVLFPFIPKGSARTESYSGRILDRGIYAIGPVNLRSTFPMGLITQTVSFPETQILAVHPRLGILTSNWTHATAPVRSGVGSFHRRHSQSEGEYHSLRDYRVGDSQRWIHWRTSAKRRKLTVRQFERRHNHDLTIVLELPYGDEHMEQAIRFVATLGYSQCRQANNRLTLVIAGDEVSIVSGMASSGLFQELSLRLAAAGGTDEDRVPKALEMAREHLKGETRLLFVSPKWIDPHDTDRFASAWDELRLRPFLLRSMSMVVGTPEFNAIYKEPDR